jgi:hypothetical protein
MTPAQTFAANGIRHIISELGSPYFIWNGQLYSCIASVSQFNRDLVEGGFTVEQMLTLTVPLFDESGGRVFAGETYPQAQEKVTFNGKVYRIENVKQDSIFQDGSSPTRLRIVAMGITRGI